MQKLFLLAILSLSFVALLGCKGQKVESQWAPDTIIVDGNSDDWLNVSLNFNDDPEIVYGIANNDTSLNFLLQFNSQDLARTIARRGMILWLDENNDKAKVLGIHYADESVRSEMPRVEGGFDRRRAPKDRGDQMQVPLVGRFTLDLKDSQTGNDIRDIQGLEAAAVFHDGVYSYEFGVALNDSTKAHFLSLAEDNEIGVCLEICGMSEAEKERMKSMMEERRAQGGASRGGMSGGMGGRGGGMGGGMSGGMGGRGGGAGGPGGPGMSMPNTDAQEMWLRIRVANNESM